MSNARAAVFLIVMFVLAGCVPPPPAPGPQASPAPRFEAIVPDQRIPIIRPGSAGRWEGADLFIDYRYTADPGGMTITGAIHFLDSLKYGFGVLNYFNSGIIIGDSEGRVIGTIPLAPARLSGTGDWTVRFTKPIPLPPRAAVFAFTYDGELLEVAGRRHGGMGGNPTRIWHNPVRR